MVYFTRYTMLTQGFVRPLEISKGETMTPNSKSNKGSRDFQSTVSQSEKPESKWAQKRIRKQVPLYMGAGLLEHLDKFAVDHDLSRSAAIRTLIREGLKVHGYGIIIENE